MWALGDSVIPNTSAQSQLLTQVQRGQKTFNQPWHLATASESSLLIDLGCLVSVLGVVKKRKVFDFGARHRASLLKGSAQGWCTAWNSP